MPKTKQPLTNYDSYKDMDPRQVQETIYFLMRKLGESMAQGMSKEGFNLVGFRTSRVWTFALEKAFKKFRSFKHTELRELDPHSRPVTEITDKNYRDYL